MRPATDVVNVEDQLVRAVMATTDLTKEEVGAGVTWVEEAMLRSRFNQYHEFGKTVRHLRLAISVAEDDLGFSLEAHGFQPLTEERPIGRSITAIAAILDNTDALRAHIESLPTL